MIDPKAIPAGARLYLRPEAIVDTPVGRDGEVARIAGGLLWFAAYELIAVVDGARVVQASVPVAMLPGADRQPARGRRPRGCAGWPSASRRPARADRRHADDPARPAAGDGDPERDAGQLLRRRRGTAIRRRRRGPGSTWARRARRSSTSAANRPGPGRRRCGKATRSRASSPSIRALARQRHARSRSTRARPAVMEAALAAGAGMVNDVAALAWDARALDVAARRGCPVVLMHSPDPAKGPHWRAAATATCWSRCSTGSRRGSTRSSRAASIGRAS